MMYLRPSCSDDAAHIHRWIDSEYTLRIWSGPRHPTYPFPAEELAAVYDSYAGGGVNFPVVAWDEGGLAGALTLRRIAEGHVRLCNVIVPPARRGQGLGKQLIALALRAAFADMGAETVDLGVFSGNAIALGCSRAAGFGPLGEETTEYHTFAGRTWPVLRMAITKADWQKPL